MERTTDSGETETVKRLEPIITGIAVRDFSAVAAADAPRDQVLVDGTVETVGGKANVDPAIWLEGGGLVTVGANGRVSADSGLAISGGCSSDYRKARLRPCRWRIRDGRLRHGGGPHPRGEGGRDGRRRYPRARRRRPEPCVDGRLDGHGHGARPRRPADGGGQRRAAALHRRRDGDGGSARGASPAWRSTAGPRRWAASPAT